ncbi:MAG: succinate dehydrogenase, hydrophobic membrane anchor protein [Steroidobacteraceae bacterium]
MSIKSPLGRVLGHGSAKQGSSHWRIERMTAIALLPLTVWFVWSLLALPSFDYDDVVVWMATPWSAVLLVVFVLAVTVHSMLGMQVFFEDYLHGPSIKCITLLLNNFVHVLTAAAGVFAVLKIAVGGN